MPEHTSAKPTNTSASLDTTQPSLYAFRQQSEAVDSRAGWRFDDRQLAVSILRMIRKLAFTVSKSLATTGVLSTKPLLRLAD
jgi:hypothetical protein